MAVATRANADTGTVTIPLQGALGQIAAASSGLTTFSFDPSSGAVSRVSGSGVRVSTTTARIGVSLSCSVPACSGKVTVTVAASGSATNRAAPLTSFNFATGTNITINSSTVGASSSRATMTVSTGQTSATFFVGAQYPIYGDDSLKTSGISGSPFTVTAGNNKWNNNNVGTSTATVYRSLQLSKSTDLAFGRIVQPSSGSGSITLDPTTGARTTSGSAVALSSPTPTRAAFSIVAEGGSTFNIDVSPATFSLSGPSSSSIPVTIAATTLGSQTPGGSLGTPVTVPLGIGGSMTIDSSTHSGAYSGTFAVTVSYN